MKSLLLAAMLFSPLLAWSEPTLPKLEGLISPQQMEALRSFHFTPEQAGQFQGIMQDVVMRALQSENPREHMGEIQDRLQTVLTPQQWQQLDGMKPSPEQVDMAVGAMAGSQDEISRRLQEEGPKMIFQFFQALQQKPLRDMLPKLR